MGLTFGLVFARMLDEPVRVVSVDLRRSRIKTGELPFRAHLLKNHRHGAGVLTTFGIHDSDAIFAWRKTVQHEYSTVPRLSSRSENTAKEFSAGYWLAAFRREQKWRPDGGLRSR